MTNIVAKIVKLRLKALTNIVFMLRSVHVEFKHIKIRKRENKRISAEVQVNILIVS